MLIETISPVHIGGKEQTLSFLDYVVSKDRIFVANENALLQEMEKKGVLKDFTQGVIQKQRTGENDLTSLIKSYGAYDNTFVNAISAYTVSKNFVLGASDKPEIKPFVRNGHYQPYIPGSSLKGSIRTAILYNYLKKVSRNDYERVVSTFKKKINEVPRGKVMKEWEQKRFSEKFLTSIFNSYYLSQESKNDYRYRFGPNTDIMRAIQISDTPPLNKNSLELNRVRVLNYKRGEEKLLGIKMSPECIPVGKKIESFLKVDTQVLKYFKENNGKQLPFNSEKDIINCCNEFSKDIIRSEISYYEGFKNVNTEDILEFYNGLDANLKLGWGSGLTATTIFLLLESESDKYKSIFKNYSSEIPVSRRVVTTENNEIVSSLGWVKIS
ncbi:MAG TPA: type III-A CRISPR-associated RAMP protein Csm5 [Methanofastidiosum sp.]|jgi:CRISPR-associated protein Csm5|nr:type III-A CRISPR-associated RAMP protein Csm5 [Methanofastidiosum sp.]